MQKTDVVRSNIFTQRKTWKGVTTDFISRKLDNVICADGNILGYIMRKAYVHDKIGFKYNAEHVEIK